LPVMSIPGPMLGILAPLDISKSRGKLGGKGTAITGLVLSGIGVLLVISLGFAVSKVQVARQRIEEKNNLMQMGVAMHNFASTYDSAIPQAAAYQDENGKPLLSWRVALLPYLEN